MGTKLTGFSANLVRREIVIPAYAKINLTLEVLGMRDDGYHAIRSIVSPIALHDDLHISANDSGEFTVETTADAGVDISAIGSVDRNLAVRAARLFFSRLGDRLRSSAGGQSGRAFGASIRITKRIPLGGGLGGGSADGAATLRGLNSMFSAPPFSRDELVGIGAEIGSDVPSLVHGGTVLMEGRGEKVTALVARDGASPLAAYHIVLANPGINVSTAEAYGRCHAQDDGLTPTPFLDNILRSSNFGGNLRISPDWLFNGLEESVFAMHPEIERISARLKEAGARGVLMSGSGATVFALAESREDAERISRSVSAECRWQAITETLPDGVMAAHGPLEA